MTVLWWFLLLLGQLIVGPAGGFLVGILITRRRWRRYHTKAISQLANEVLALQLALQRRPRPRELIVTRIGPPLSGLRVDIDGVRYSIPSVDWTERRDLVADVLVLHFKLPADPDPGRPLSSALVDDNPDLEPVHMPPGWTSSPLPPATGRGQLRAVPAPTDDPYRGVTYPGTSNLPREGATHMSNLPTTSTGQPAWHYAAGIGPVWHGLELLGARDPAELIRMGWDVEYFVGAPAGAVPVVDVYTGRVVFPADTRPKPVSSREAVAALRPTSDLAWPMTWPMALADLRHVWLIEMRRAANAARARLGLLSADDEDTIENDGGTIVGAVGYDRRGYPIIAGAAATGTDYPARLRVGGAHRG